MKKQPLCLSPATADERGLDVSKLGPDWLVSKCLNTESNDSDDRDDDYPALEDVVVLCH